MPRRMFSRSKWTLTGMIAAGLMSTYAIASSGGASWGYTGEKGPANWDSLDTEFMACGSGRNQSPVNLTRIVEADAPAVTFHYSSAPLKVVNNGHTVKVDYEPGSYIEVGEQRFELKQFHFHSPSEHRVSGKSYPVEGHLVHADSDGNLAVVAVFFEEGAENASLRPVWENMPEREGHQEAHDGVTVDAEALLPEEREFYRYSGSLTTPPCTEGVTWLVMQESATVSQAQVERFHSLMGTDNNRPVQELNARVILD